MKKQELLKLGFVDTSYIEEGNNFTQFTFKSPGVTIEVSGNNCVEVKLNGMWSFVSNCKNITDLRYLIKLFAEI